MLCGGTIKLKIWLLVKSVQQEISIPTCDQCNEEWIDADTAEALDKLDSKALAELADQQFLEFAGKHAAGIEAK
jgi:hypothetical protein